MSPVVSPVMSPVSSPKPVLSIHARSGSASPPAMVPPVGMLIETRDSRLSFSYKAPSGTHTPMSLMSPKLSASRCLLHEAGSNNGGNTQRCEFERLVECLRTQIDSRFNSVEERVRKNEGDVHVITSALQDLASRMEHFRSITDAVNMTGKDTKHEFQVTKGLAACKASPSHSTNFMSNHIDMPEHLQVAHCKEPLLLRDRQEDQLMLRLAMTLQKVTADTVHLRLQMVRMIELLQQMTPEMNELHQGCKSQAVVADLNAASSEIQKQGCSAHEHLLHLDVLTETGSCQPVGMRLNSASHDTAIDSSAWHDQLESQPTNIHTIVHQCIDRVEKALARANGFNFAGLLDIKSSEDNSQG